MQQQFFRCSWGDVPPRLRNAITVVAFDCVVLFGGKTATGVSDGLYVMDCSTCEWKRIQAEGAWRLYFMQTFPEPRYDGAAVFVPCSTEPKKGYVVMFGGRTTTYDDSIWLLHLDFEPRIPTARMCEFPPTRFLLHSSFFLQVGSELLQVAALFGQ